MLSPTLRTAPQVAVLFIVNGFLMGSWGGLLASIRDRLGIDEASVSTLLILVGLSAVITMQVSGRLSDRIGARRPTLVGATVMMLAFGILAWAESMTIAILGACVLGLGNGAMDVGMNSLAVTAEKTSRLRIMSTLHAFFSIGSLLGAGTVLTAQALTGGPGGTVVASTLSAIVIAAVLLLATTSKTPNVPSGEGMAERLPRAPLPPVTWLLGVMAICFGITEGTGWDWSGIHVTDVVGVSAGVGATGLAAFSGAMVAVRLIGDALVERFGRRRVLLTGSFVAVGGYTLAMTQQAMLPVLLGWALVGAGIAQLAPQIYGLAGHIGGGRMLGVVAGCGYLTFLAGPALIGYASQAWGVDRAMAIPLTTGLLVGALALLLPASTERAAHSLR